MRFARRQSRERQIDFDLTPMIDVVFLLIIFFMTTAQLARLTRADVKLPREKGEQSESKEDDGIVINITDEGEIIVSDRTLTLVDLEALLMDEVTRHADDAAHQLRVMLRADRRADASVLNEVVRLLQRQGVAAAKLGTEVP